MVSKKAYIVYRNSDFEYLIEDHCLPIARTNHNAFGAAHLWLRVNDLYGEFVGKVADRYEDDPYTGLKVSVPVLFYEEKTVVNRSILSLPLSMQWAPFNKIFPTVFGYEYIEYIQRGKRLVEEDMRQDIDLLCQPAVGINEEIVYCNLLIEESKQGLRYTSDKGIMNVMDRLRSLRDM